MPTAIEFNHVSKQYRLGLVSTRTLSHDLQRWWTMNIRGKEDPYLKIGETNDRATKGSSDYVWALKDIDFKVEQGDVVGIIGKNGAGKSTLLKLLSKVTGPTTGSIKARGRIGALLEVGTGFHSEMTGRENIFLNGAILGMNRHEIAAKLDEIVDFSGCERYLDTPVKRYSSGMMVRLGFAVAAHLDPEILVVDEVLAVGDAEFQKKAIGKMQDVSKGEGRTVLFVSHNMDSIDKLCHTGIVLRNGMIDYCGTASDCINYYTQRNIEVFSDHAFITSKDHILKNVRDIEYLEVSMENDVSNMSNEEPILISAKVKRINRNLSKCQFGVVIRDRYDSVVCSSFSNVVQLPVNDIFSIKLNIPNHNLAKGKYYVNLNIASCDYNTHVIDYDIIYKALSFEVNFLDSRHSIPFSYWNMKGCAITNSIATIEG